MCCLVLTLALSYCDLAVNSGNEHYLLNWRPSALLHAGVVDLCCYVVEPSVSWLPGSCGSITPCSLDLVTQHNWLDWRKKDTNGIRTSVFVSSRLCSSVLKRGLECPQAVVSSLFPLHVKCLLFKKLLLLVNFLDLGSQDTLLTEIWMAFVWQTYFLI